MCKFDQKALVHVFVTRHLQVDYILYLYTHLAISVYLLELIMVTFDSRLICNSRQIIMVLFMDLFSVCQCRMLCNSILISFHTSFTIIIT